MMIRRSCLVFAVTLLATLSLARSGAAAEPRWAPLGPPAAPLAARLVVEPGNGNRVYAFNAAGLWLSRDDAGSWRSIQAGLGRAPHSVTFDPFRPGRIYALVAETDYTGTIYRSDDFGNRWTPVSRTGPVGSIDPQDLVADPFTKDTLLRIDYDRRLYRSRDAGKTWSCVAVAEDCIHSHQAHAVAFAPDRPKTLYVIHAFGDFFYASHDDGRTWTMSHLTVPYVDTLVATREPRTLYAWSRNAGYRGSITSCFARSDDEGETWKGILQDTKCGAPAVDPGDPRTVRMVVVADRVPQLWVSRDGGDTWTSAGAVPEFGDLYSVPGSGLALATDKGFFRAPGEQGPWKRANRGFRASDIGAILPVAEAVLAAPLFEGYLELTPVSLLRTGDGGRSWEGIPLTNPIALASDPSDPLHLIASAMRYYDSDRHYRILESRDGGHTWRGVVDPQAPHPLATALAIDPFEPRTFYIGAGPSGGVYRSDDGGRTWSPSGVGLPPLICTNHGCLPRQVHTILTDPAQAGRMFIRLNNSLYRSLDYGITWTEMRTHQRPTAGFAYALARDLQGALIVIGDGSRPGDANSLGVAYRSPDGGATWTRLGRLPLPRLVDGRRNEPTGLAAARGALWISTSYFGVFRSTDGGATWKPANEGLPLLSVTSLVADPEDPARLFVTVPGNGIYTLAAP